MNPRCLSKAFLPVAVCASVLYLCRAAVAAECPSCTGHEVSGPGEAISLYCPACGWYPQDQYVYACAGVTTWFCVSAQDKDVYGDPLPCIATPLTYQWTDSLGHSKYSATYPFTPPIGGGGTYWVMCEVIDPTGYGADPSHPVVFWMVYAIESVDLDIKDVADNDEATKGAVVVRNYDSNEAPRKEIDIATQPLSWPGNLKLTWSSKVKVYDAATGGNLKTSPYVFSGGADGTLWVQGDSASSTMRDVEIKLTPEPCDTISDTVNFTVLWVTVTGRYSGSVSSDNSRYEAYMRYVMPLGDDTLGFHRYLLAPYVLGLGREFVGTVAPSDFDPTSINAGSKVYLGRILDSSYQYDDQIVLSSTIGPIEDTGPPEWRDDDPQSGGSNGKIYDLDFPGLAPSFGDSDYIARSRMNFTESAGFYEASASVPVRCSEFLQEYSRQTLRKTGNEETHAASGGNATTLWDTQRTWSTNEWAPGLVKIISGKGAGQVRYVVSNTAVTLTVAPGWDAGGTPDATSVYDVINQTTWTQWTDVTGDNQGGDGTTNTTWNLQ